LRKLIRRMTPSTGEISPFRVDHRVNDQDVALILVHGFSGDTGATWAAFVNLLLGDPALTSWDLFSLGYSSSLRIDVPNVWAADPDIETLASGLKTTLSLPPFSHYRCVAIAAHSMGGLVVQRAILIDPKLADRLSHVFLFGTPSAGLSKAWPFSGLKRQVRDMAATSSFIHSLRHEWNIRFGSGSPFALKVVAGDRDEFVPARSSLEPFPGNAREVVPGNHLEIIKPTGPDHQSYILVMHGLSGGTQSRSVVDGARLSVELGDFRAAVKALLPHSGGLDDNALATLALALDGLNRGEEALLILEQHGKFESTDALGVLAGRIKRRWLVERSSADLHRARELYSVALDQAEASNDPEQSFYHAINIAFLDLIASPASADIPTSVRGMAERVKEYCSNARETNWRVATEAEACLMLEDFSQAVSLYPKAISLTQSPREIESMYSQAVRVATRVFGRKGTKGIEQVFGASPNVTR